METEQKNRSAQRRRSSAPAGRTRSAGTGKMGATRKRPQKTQSQERKPRAQRAARTRQPEQETPSVVYTPAKPFNRSRFLLQLLIIVLVVAALTFSMSIFFKVQVIRVSGCEKYTQWEVREASGIQSGENLLSLSNARAAGKIIAALPYVESVRIGIKLPDTVNIEIKELDVVYSVRSTDGQWWLMSSEGKIVEKADVAAAGACTTILGVELAYPKENAMAEAAEAIQAAAPVTDDNANPGDVTTAAPQIVTGAQRLQTALTLLQYLESNGIIGDAASVDVSNLQDIELWYGTRFQVRLGDSNKLSYKISCMKNAIDQMNDYTGGELDVSFAISEDQVIYTPFA